MHMLQETLITFPVLKLDTTSSKLFLSFCNNRMEQFRSYPSELKNFVVLKNSILKFIRPSPSNVFNCNNYKGLSRRCA